MAYGTINADQIGTSVANTSLGAGNASIMKNRIINGAMVIDQRNAGAAVTVNGVGILCTDRWANIARPTGGGVYSAQQVSDAPTGFSNSLKLTVTTADTSLGTSDYYFSWQKIEGFNTSDLMFGTANAKTVTLSFWVKSSITGQFSTFLTNSAESYSQPFAYTINSANTWEQKTITFTGATAGTWIGATNGVGLIVGFGLANGTNLLGTSGVWAASNYYGSTGDVNWMATNGNTFQYTGVQLEVGSSATGYEYRQYTTELALCQRYCPAWSIPALPTWGAIAYGQQTTTSRALVFTNLPVTTRTPATGITVNNVSYLYLNPFSGATGTVSSLSWGEASLTSCWFVVNTSNSITSGSNTFLDINSTSGIVYLTGCEL